MKAKRTSIIASIAVIVAASLAQTTPVHAETSTSAATPQAPAGVYGPKGSPGKADSADGKGATFHYVDGSVTGFADGASVRIDQAGPGIGPAYHSLVELAVESRDSKQIVEVGWTVDKGLNGDGLPHLFVFHWVDNAPTCYNGCGFVQVSAVVRPGEVVRAGDSRIFGIQRFGSDWWVGYAGIWFGFFPGSLWHGTYAEAGLTQVFGEVATDGPGSCTMMGDGTFGTWPGSTTVSQFKLINPLPQGSPLVPLVTDPLHYSQEALSNTSFRLGGPGTC